MPGVVIDNTIQEDAGGSAEDLIFGQAGNDVLQGLAATTGSPISRSG
ncbi:hypothetical protein [Inquilinus sp.]|jgi:hypothetical protein